MQIQDLEIWRGNDVTLPFEFDDLTGNDYSLVGASLKFTTDSVSTLEIPLTISDAASGKASLSLTSAQTRLLPLGRVTQYEIEETRGGKQTTLLSGMINAQGGVNVD